MTSLAEVRGLSTEAAARALETEAARSVPDNLVRKLGAAGAFRLFVPASLDGPQVDPMTAMRFLIVPASDVEILDTWHVAGLRGTASNDVVVDGAIVPLERTANPILEKAPHDEPHVRWSFFGLLARLPPRRRGALYDDSPLQRCWRDLHAGSSHIYFSDNHIAKSGKVLLGQPTDEWVM